MCRSQCVVRVCLLLAVAAVGAACGAATRTVSNTPSGGLSAALASHSSAIQGDETASLAAGETMTVDSYSVKGLIELPVMRGRWGGAALRFTVGIRVVDAHLDAVTLNELKGLAPKLADLIADTAENVDTFLVDDSLSDRGADALSQNLAHQVDMHDVGGEVGLMFLGAGPRIGLWGDAYIELAEFGLGGFFHLSDLEVIVTTNRSRRGDHYLGFGVGLAVRMAPLTVVVPSLGGARMQSAALAVELFGLLTEDDLRAIVLSAAFEAQLAWSF